MPSKFYVVADDLLLPLHSHNILTNRMVLASSLLLYTTLCVFGIHVNGFVHLESNAARRASLSYYGRRVKQALPSVSSDGTITYVGKTIESFKLGKV